MPTTNDTKYRPCSFAFFCPATDRAAALDDDCALQGICSGRRDSRAALEDSDWPSAHDAVNVVTSWRACQSAARAFRIVLSTC